MTFSYTKTIEINFANVIRIEDIIDTIKDSLFDYLDEEISFNEAYEETFEAIANEAYRYVATELNKMVE